MQSDLESECYECSFNKDASLLNMNQMPWEMIDRETENREEEKEQSNQFNDAVVLQNDAHDKQRPRSPCDWVQSVTANAGDTLWTRTSAADKYE